MLQHYVSSGLDQVRGVFGLRFFKLKSDGAHSSACPSQAWLKVYSAAKNLEKGEVDDKSCRIGGIVTNIR